MSHCTWYTISWNGGTPSDGMLVHHPLEWVVSLAGIRMPEHSKSVSMRGALETDHRSGQNEPEAGKRRTQPRPCLRGTAPAPCATALRHRRATVALGPVLPPLVAPHVLPNCLGEGAPSAPSPRRSLQADIHEVGLTIVQCHSDAPVEPNAQPLRLPVVLVVPVGQLIGDTTSW